MEILRVNGSHFECGSQVGKAYKVGLHILLNWSQTLLPDNTTWDQYVQAAASNYLAPTQQNFPFLVQQIQGIAEGAGIPFEKLFPLFVDELDDDNVLGTTRKFERCTDVVVATPTISIAHNNDLTPMHTKLVSGVLWQTPDAKVLTFGHAGLPSIGVGKRNGSSNIIVLSGDEVENTDTKNRGLPRYLAAWGILYSDSVKEALHIATHPDRASSYRNIIAVKDSALIVEASATAHRIITTDDNSRFAFTNHFTHPHMVQFDRDPHHVGSNSRLKRGRELVSKINTTQDLPDQLKKIMRDHGEGTSHSKSTNMTICKEDLGMDVATNFSTIFSFSLNGDLVVEALVGIPCQNEYHEVYRFVN
ncbi:hypothetical protein HY310_00875 [Candidatus Microgenomates bacterium]|nr:hypothetical protein [Candidatus Microgenomates bacterium]